MSPNARHIIIYTDNNKHTHNHNNMQNGEHLECGVWRAPTLRELAHEIKF